MIDGERKKLYAFSYMLGYSRYRYAEFITDIGTQATIKMHINAFRYTGGIPSEVLYDNIKQVVLERKIKASESEFNMDFMRFSEYYGFNVRLCWPYRPQTKGKIENTIKYVKGNFFNGRTFESLSDLNSQCSAWLRKVNSQIHGTTGKIPAEIVGEETLARIDAVSEFTYRITRTRKVSRECYVHYNANRYSVPWKYAGRESTVTEESGILKIKIGDEIIEHGVLQGSGRISRKKEHFEGLLKAVSDRNARNYGIEVEKRDLKNYEVV